MECKYCYGKWDIYNILGGKVRFCPLCGQELKNSIDKMESISDCINYIVVEFGKEKLKDSRFVLSLISDFLPGLTVEKRILKTVLESGAYDSLLSDYLEANELEVRTKKAIKHLVDEYGMSDIWAKSAIEC